MQNGGRGKDSCGGEPWAGGGHALGFGGFCALMGRMNSIALLQELGRLDEAIRLVRDAQELALRPGERRKLLAELASIEAESPSQDTTWRGARQKTTRCCGGAVAASCACLREAYFFFFFATFFFFAGIQTSFGLELDHARREPSRSLRNGQLSSETGVVSNGLDATRTLGVEESIAHRLRITIHLSTKTCMSRTEP